MNATFRVVSTLYRYSIHEPIRLTLNPISIGVIAGTFCAIIDRVKNLMNAAQAIDPHCRFIPYIRAGLRHLPLHVDHQFQPCNIPLQWLQYYFRLYSLYSKIRIYRKKKKLKCRLRPKPLKMHK